MFYTEFFSGVQSLYFSESQDATVLQICYKNVFETHKFAVRLIDMGNNDTQDPKAQNFK